MSDTNDTEGSGSESGRKDVRSLRELAHDVSPPRDLWPAIAATIAAEDGKGARNGRDSAISDISHTGSSSRSASSTRRMQWAALAAVVAALAVGVWVGRNVLPVGGVQSPEHIAGNTTQDLVSAAYVRDPRYLKDRAELVRSLEQKMKTLPPATQAKVTASLATIRKSIADIQDALGRDPGNALLQELLVNTYQDEMRVLTTVHEVDDAAQEI
jgi:hypothetical protein